MTKFTNITLVWMAFQNGQPVSLLLFQKDTYKASEYKTMVMANIEIDLVYKMFDETSISYLWCQAYMTDLMLLPPSRSIRLQAINTNNELPQCHHNEIFAFPSQQCLFEYSMFMRSTSLPTVRYQPITTARRTANSNTDQQTNYNKCSGAEIAIIVLTEFITLVVFILVGFLIAYIVWRKYKFHIQGKNNIHYIYVDFHVHIIASEVDEDTEIRHHCNEWLVYFITSERKLYTFLLQCGDKC